MCTDGVSKDLIRWDEEAMNTAFSSRLTQRTGIRFWHTVFSHLLNSGQTHPAIIIFNLNLFEPEIFFCCVLFCIFLWLK